MCLRIEDDDEAGNLDLQAVGSAFEIGLVHMQMDEDE